jgi:hypothetical protein
VRAHNLHSLQTDQLTTSLMAHMKGMAMCDMLVGLGTRLRPSARAPELDYAPRTSGALARDAMRQWMAQNEHIGASLRAYGTGFVCLSTPEHTQHYWVVGHSLIHSAVTLSRHHR